MDIIDRLEKLLERYVTATEARAVAAVKQATAVEQIAEMARRSEEHFRYLTEHQPFNSTT